YTTPPRPIPEHKNHQNTKHPYHLGVILPHQPPSPREMHARNRFSEPDRIDQPTVHPLGIGIKVVTELISQKVLFGQNDCLVNKQEKRYENDHVKQGINQ